MLYQTDHPTMLTLDYDRDIMVREFQFAILDDLFSEEVTFYDNESCALTLVIQDPDQ